MKGKDLLSISDLSSEEINVIITDAIDMKNDGWLSILDRKTMALVFEKPSLRTRVSFEVAMRQLGGTSICLSPSEVGLGKRERVEDVSRVLSRYVDVIVARTFSHETLKSLAASADVPVINALSDVEHPCQALADILTIYEKKGEIKGLTIGYIGDGNNVANSLMLACALMGAKFRIASPEGYKVAPELLNTAEGLAADNGGEINLVESPAEAARAADVVYTDVWTSMGQETEADERRRVFARYQVNEDLLSLADEEVIFMHPLPAHHGEEISEELLENSHSVVFDQAENRMHAQKAILAEMLGGLDVFLRRHK